MTFFRNVPFCDPARGFVASIRGHAFYGKSYDEATDRLLEHFEKFPLDNDDSCGKMWPGERQAMIFEENSLSVTTPHTVGSLCSVGPLRYKVEKTPGGFRAFASPCGDTAWIAIGNTLWVARGGAEADCRRHLEAIVGAAKEMGL